MANLCDARIIIVEDNPIDVLMLKLALKKGGFNGTATIFDDGIPAIEFLQKIGTADALEAIDLVILDLNLPHVDGPEVLDFIRGTPHLSSVRVFVVSSSPSDVMTERAASANAYFSKPSDLQSFLRLGDEIMSEMASTVK